MTDGQEILIDLADVSRSFDTPQGPRHILEQVSLQIPRGSFTVIRGQSGAGKTTLLRILGFLDSGFSGGYRFNGLDTTRLTTAERDDVRTDAVGFVFQDGRLLNHLSIGENIALPLTFRNHGGPEIAARLEQAASIAFRESERAAGIVTLSPGAASGGQQQRAAVARAMITAPDVILADEPTANLDETAKALVLVQLHRLHESGATVIVVSHDDIFFDTGTQYRLDAGRLSRIGAAPEGPAPTPPATPAPKPRIPLAGWWPRLAPKTLLRHALWGVIRRPLFTVLTLVSLMAAVCQVAIFTSLIGGLNVFVEQTITQGSRLNRITVKPRRADLSADDRFPLRGEITASPDVTAVSARRASSITIVNEKGQDRPFPTLGLHAADPELALFNFVAGTGFSANPAQFELLATTTFLTDLFDLGTANDPALVPWQNYVGRPVTVAVPRFDKTGKKTSQETLVAHITGVILNGEAGRQFYLPNDLLIAIDAIKRDRANKIRLPLNADRTGWEAGSDLSALLNWPWEDMLHVYIRDLDRVLPSIEHLSKSGFRPEAEIWNFLWVLDLRQAAFSVFVPILLLVSGVVALVLFSNIYISARLREAELALSKVLGMRRGDILVTELLGVLMLAIAGILAGLLAADYLTGAITEHLRRTSALAAELSGGTATTDASLIFSPVWGYAPQIVAFTLFVVTLAVLWPTLRAARTDPARVFARSG